MHQCNKNSRSHRQNIGEDSDQGIVEVPFELFIPGVADFGHVEGVGAGVADAVIRQQEEGSGGCSGQHQHDGDQDLMYQRGLVAR